jgi:flagellar FliL protein
MPDKKIEPPVTKKSKLKFIIIGIVVALLLAAGGGYFYMQKPTQPKKAVVEPPVYLPLDSFTVNLKSVDGSQEFLQISITLQLDNEKEVETFKNYSPVIKSRLIYLLSSKTADNLKNNGGKIKLQEEIQKELETPFIKDNPIQPVKEVLFTTLIIQ